MYGRGREVRTRRVLEAIFAASVLSGLSMLVVSHASVVHGQAGQVSYVAPAHAPGTRFVQAVP